MEVFSQTPSRVVPSTKVNDPKPWLWVDPVWDIVMVGVATPVASLTLILVVTWIGPSDKEV